MGDIIDFEASKSTKNSLESVMKSITNNNEKLISSF